ncbi:MAG: hypothetical protein IKD73_02275 [Selenomonadaceae bacterium]|nr:hypothetical protein [Selenomonadaceae bacterium]
MANLKATNTAGGRRKGIFALRLKDNLEVRTLEELRDNFDLEKAIEYFHSGELLQWLEDRFYDDEADAIRELSGDDSNLSTKLCAALNVECDDNLDFMRRVREKKAYLVEHTDDQTIIDNAAATALDQGDLGELIQLGYTTIYLCGEQFNVPIRVAGVKYVGILGAPKIKIRAKSQDDLDAQNISFENVQLPWQKSLPIEELKALAEKVFQTGGKWPLVKDGKQVSTFDQLSQAEKSAALRMFAQGKYSESQIAFMQLTEDFASGFAMTIDSFCTAGSVGHNTILYKDIQRALRAEWGGVAILMGSKRLTFSFSPHDRPYNLEACAKLFKQPNDYEKVAKFLEVAKNF